MKKILGVLVLCACVSAAPADVWQFGLNSPDDSGGFLEGSYVVPSSSTTATGGEVGLGISYDGPTSMLNLNCGYGSLGFGFQPLQGNFVSAKLYQGSAGANGTEMFDLTPYHFPLGISGKSGLILEAAFLLSPTLDNALFNSDLYIQINSVAFPGGEIRAQLIPVVVPEPSSWFLAGLGLAGLLIFRKR
jgi:hypothetical protein